ncbi:MAG TPA: hypothetical protein VGQ96_03885 [Candidatus Eremiobacteraceae bacterium]|nr:hypothetical protein [Candidatus Eremiobacteraceae bacterium]
MQLWETAASIGTFVVIAATAIAAVLQLRHMRSANQVNAIETFAAAYGGLELRSAFDFVRAELPRRLEDPEFRRELREGDLPRSKHPEISICNFFDQWGLYYRDGAIDKNAFMRVNAAVVVQFWKHLEPVVCLLADPVKGNTSFQQFEYLTIQALRWLEQHPDGDWPRGEKRLPLIDRWQETRAVRLETRAK